MHWAVPAELVRPLVPSSLELDLFDGVLYVGVVPFVMEHVRPRWLPDAMAFDFLETNLRTYVLHDGEPGVFFLSLEAASALACLAARATFGLPYHYARMERREEGGEVFYQTDRRVRGAAKSTFHYRIGEELGPSVPGSLQHFLVERYYLFVERWDTVYRGVVHHVPYPVRAAEVLACDEGLMQAAGLPRPTRLPDLAHFSPGVEVEVFDLEPHG